MSLRFNTQKDIKRNIAKVLNMLLDDKIEPKKANAFVFGCNALLESIRVDEQEKRIADIEELIKEKQEDKKS